MNRNIFDGCFDAQSLFLTVQLLLTVLLINFAVFKTCIGEHSSAQKYAEAVTKVSK